MLTIYLYFWASIAFFILFLFFVNVYQKNNDEFTYYYALGFLFMFLMNFFNSVPVLSSMSLTVAAWGNLLSNLSFFLLIFTCFRIQLVASDNFFRKNKYLFDIALFIILAITLSLQISTLSLPTITKIGINWNINNISAYLMSATSICCGLYWSYTFGKVGTILKDNFLKRRINMLSTNGILMGTAGLFFFQNNITFSLIGIAILFTAALVSMLVFMIPEKQSQSKLSRA